MRRHLVVIVGLLGVMAGCADGPRQNHQQAASGGQFLNPLTGKPYDSGLSPESIAESKALDEVQALFRDGLYDRARIRLDALIAGGCHQAQALFLRAKLAHQAGDHAATVTWCERTLKESPLWGEPRLMLARAFLKLERPAAAAAVFADLDRMAPDLPWGPSGLGFVAASQGNFAEAAKQYDRALARDPDDLYSLEARSQLANQAGDQALESRLLLRLVALQPQSAAIQQRLGELAEEDGRLDDARRFLERAYELEPRPDTAKHLASLATRRGDPEAARRWRLRSGAVGPAIDPETPPELR